MGFIDERWCDEENGWVVCFYRRVGDYAFNVLAILLLFNKMMRSVPGMFEKSKLPLDFSF